MLKTTKRKKAFPFLFSVFPLIFLIGGFFFTSFISDTVIKINGVKVEKDEFIWAMNCNRSAVLQTFLDGGYTSANGSVWEKEVKGQVPYKVLADKSLETLLYTHAVLNLAADHNYLPSNGFKALQKSFRKENNERKEKIAKGEPVYGLTSFNFNDYVEYSFNSFQESYCSDSNNSDIDITEEERKKYYEENKQLYPQEDEIEVAYIKLEYYTEELDEQTIMKLEQEVNKLRQKVLSGYTLEEEIKNFPILQPYFHNQNVTSEEYSYYSRTIGDVLDLASDLERDQVTEVLHKNGTLFLIQCLERVHHDYIPYSQLINQINKSIREERYEEVIKKYMKEVKIEYQLEEIYKFTKNNIK